MCSNGGVFQWQVCGRLVRRVPPGNRFDFATNLSKCKSSAVTHSIRSTSPFSVPAARSRENMFPIASQADAIAIDNSSVFRMEPHVPLVVPEINAEDVRRHRGLIANPNCTTAVTLMALYPLHRVFGVRRIFAASYQAVSGSGTRAIEELKQQTKTAVQEQESRPGSRPRLSSGSGYGLSAPHRVQPSPACRFISR